jgi:hypothetical protein
MLEELSPQLVGILHGTADGSDIGIWGFVTECHRLALSKHVEGFGPDDIVTLIHRHPDCRWHLLTSLKDDVELAWQACLKKAREEIERKTKARELAASLLDPWADPLPPEWPRGVLRADYEATIEALARRDGLDFGVLAMAYVVAVSGAADKTMRFEPFQHSGWSEPPILYAMPIAEPGFRKSTIIRTAFAAIDRRDRQQWQEYRQELADWEAADEKGRPPKPKEPSPVIVDDIGVEKLQATISRAPRGPLVLRDEIAPLFDFRRYSKGVGADARAFYLSAYEGAIRRVHRMSRDTDHGQVAATVFGCCQPDRLAEFKDLGDDGLMQRFLPLLMAERRLSEPTTVVRGQDNLDCAIDLLITQTGHPVYRTTKEGSGLIRDTEVAAHQLCEVSDYGKVFQGFCSKLVGLHARLAFVLHLLDDQSKPLIPEETIERASRLVAFCIGHARAFYGRGPGSLAEITKAVAGFILTRSPPLGDEPERIVASTLTSGVRICRGMTLKRLTEVIGPLITGGWFSPETPYPDCNAWIVTPGLRDALQERLQTEAERRRNVRELIKEVSAGRIPRSQRS